MKRSVMFWALMAGLVFGSPAAGLAATWHVDCGAPGPGSGAPGDPFRAIQAGLDACGPGDTVSVADGVCYENLVWPQTDGVRLESAGNDPAACILDGGGLASGIRAVASAGPVNLTIRGLTVRNAGDPSASGEAGVDLGSGPYAMTARIENVRVRDNHVATGVRAIGNAGAPMDLTVAHSAIRNTRHPAGYTSFGIGFGVYTGRLTVSGSTVAETAGYGVSVAAVGEVLEATVEGSRIFGNVNAASTASQYGGGLLLMASPLAGASHLVEIRGNEIHRNGGDPLFTQASYGIVLYGETLTGSVTENRVYDHLSDTGTAIGVVASGQSLLIDKNRIFNNRGAGATFPDLSSGLALSVVGDGGGTSGAYRVTSNIIVSNGGSGITVVSEGLGAEVTLANNTVADNEIVNIQEITTGVPRTAVVNCIVGDWASGSGAQDLVNVGSVSFSNVEDGAPPGEGNISMDPAFVDPAGPDALFGTADDDYHLLASSPCIDAGSPALAPPDDFDGHPRDALPDIGADEYDPNTPAGNGIEVEAPGTGVWIRFDRVTAAGQTSAEAHAGAGELPAGYELLPGAPYVDVRTSAASSGRIELCRRVPLPLPPEIPGERIRILHQEAGSFSDVTSSWDPVPGTVCGRTLGLSDTAVAYVPQGVCIDRDGDGFGNPADPSCGDPREDCDDDDADVNPGAAENCGNGKDDDCDGLTDAADPDCGGCFIATAAYGSDLCAKVGLLRQVRDRFLIRSGPGRALVSAYYAHSPAIAEAVARHGWLRSIVRVLLLPAVGAGSLAVSASG